VAISESIGNPPAPALLSSCPGPYPRRFETAIAVAVLLVVSRTEVTIPADILPDLRCRTQHSRCRMTRLRLHPRLRYSPPGATGDLSNIWTIRLSGLAVPATQERLLSAERIGHWPLPPHAGAREIMRVAVRPGNANADCCAAVRHRGE